MFRLDLSKTSILTDCHASTFANASLVLVARGTSIVCITQHAIVELHSLRPSVASSDCRRRITRQATSYVTVGGQLVLVR